MYQRDLLCIPANPLARYRKNFWPLYLSPHKDHQHFWSQSVSEAYLENRPVRYRVAQIKTRKVITAHCS